MFDVDALRRAHATFIRRNDEMLRYTAQDILDYERRVLYRRLEAHRRSGQMIRATGGRVFRTTAGRIIRVWNDTKQARFIESGTKRHIIRARNAKVLRFIGRNGAPVFRRWVLHPGTLAFHLFSQSRDDAGGYAGGLLRERMNGVANSF